MASEFSDFRAYYLTLYLSEFGGEVEFLLVDWVTWKNTRPTLATKGVQGMWRLSLDPIPTISPNRHGFRSFRKAREKDYHGLIILGGHSADIIQPETEVTDFLRRAYERGTVLGAIGAGSLPLISVGIISGKRCTGNRIVSFLLDKVGKFEDVPIVGDAKIVTARSTEDTAEFLREFSRHFDPDFMPARKGILAGRRVLIIAGEDFEDVELVAPVLEYLCRGAGVMIATFPPPIRARPPLVGLYVVVGNFDVLVPLQEISESRYSLKQLADVRMDEFDIIQIPGAFCPWNMVAAGDPVEFLKRVYDEGKYIAAICHGSIPIAAADLVQGKYLAGLNVCNEAVTIMGGTYNINWSAAVDGRIISGRVPEDVPEFLDAITMALLQD